jgi:hypothetical protein
LKKGWIDMYAIMERESKKTKPNGYPTRRGKAFYLSQHINNESDSKVIIARQVANFISDDMRKMASIMSNNIIEGLKNGGR